MKEKNKSHEITSREQMGVITDPKNLLKTIASGFPVASSLVEVSNQLEGHRVGRQIAALEAKLGDLEKTQLKPPQEIPITGIHAESEKAQPKPPPPPQEWPHAVSQYMRRFLDFTVFYDGEADAPEDAGEELFLPVAHGCFVDKGVVLACSEALELANAVANHKRGKLRLMLDQIRYDFEPEKADDGSGLVICHITGRDDKYQQEQQKYLEERGLKNLFATEPLETPVDFTVTPWLGQNVGFLHVGEATDIGGYPKVQFDTSVISHFRKASDQALKSFVTSVLPGRFVRVGSPVFTRTGMLVGVIADTESYSSDAGRRAVVKSLLGVPRFTKFVKKS